MIFEALLAATPLPPDEADADALLYAFDMMYTARQAILDRQTVRIVVTEEDRALAEQIAARDAVWSEALARTRAAVVEQGVGAKKVRRYAAAQAGNL